MTNRLYYDDSYLKQFNATVSEKYWQDTKVAVVLNQTCFYPSSGGQPYDLGSIQGIHVMGVVVRDSDQQIVHMLSEDITGSEVVGVIDWDRRFDHMQQHSGQHILSQAFLRVADAETVSFHLGQDMSTLDLATDQLPIDMLDKAEMLANRILWENREVQIKYVSLLEAQKLPLRKTPDLFGDRLRLIEIEDFDLSACGGTHVARTGEVGLIKITRTERRANGIRVEFCCGLRALKDYNHKSQVVGQLMAELTTAAGELPGSVHRLREQLKAANRQLKRQSNELISFESTKLLQEGSANGSTIFICRVFENRDPSELRMLAKNLVRNKSTVALLGVAGNQSHLVFAAADDFQEKMDSALQIALMALDTATGGGSAKFAQGVGGAASGLQIQAAIEKARQYLINQLDGVRIAPAENS